MKEKYPYLTPLDGFDIYLPSTRTSDSFSLLREIVYQIHLFAFFFSIAMGFFGGNLSHTCSPEAAACLAHVLLARLKRKNHQLCVISFFFYSGCLYCSCYLGFLGKFLISFLVIISLSLFFSSLCLL